MSLYLRRPARPPGPGTITGAVGRAGGSAMAVHARYLTEARANALIGVFISVTTIPAAPYRWVCRSRSRAGAKRGGQRCNYCSTSSRSSWPAPWASARSAGSGVDARAGERVTALREGPATNTSSPGSMMRIFPGPWL